MTKHFLHWKESDCKQGEQSLRLPVLNEIDSYYKGTLLSRILTMKKQSPISLDEAVRLLLEHEQAARKSGRKGSERGHLFWYSFHFIDWISELGHHIELSGDEFEVYRMPDKVI